MPSAQADGGTLVRPASDEAADILRARKLETWQAYSQQSISEPFEMAEGAGADGLVRTNGSPLWVLPRSVGRSLRAQWTSDFIKGTSEFEQWLKSRRHNGVATEPTRRAATALSHHESRRTTPPHSTSNSHVARKQPASCDDEADDYMGFERLAATLSKDHVLELKRQVCVCVCVCV
jgi:hypothetical protein